MQGSGWPDPATQSISYSCTQTNKHETEISHEHKPRHAGKRKSNKQNAIQNCIPIKLHHDYTQRIQYYFQGTTSMGLITDTAGGIEYVPALLLATHLKL